MRGPLHWLRGRSAIALWPMSLCRMSANVRVGYKCTMVPVIPFRRRSVLPITLGAINTAVLAFAATMAFQHWKGGAAFQHSDVKILRPDPGLTGPIKVIDGDTVRLNGTAYLIV
jgi:hypothetical protein